MAKFYGLIGYATQKQTSLGVFEEEIVERPYRGDILQNTRRWETTENRNDNLLLSNRLSIIADIFAYENLATIRYIIWHGIKWKVSNIEIVRPRLLLTCGEVYNG